MSDALDGEQQKESIAIEVFGFNWWQSDIPFGASIGLIQSDRQSVKDTGKVLFIHLDNAYTFGYSKYDNETGWFISVDLLKLISDKGSKLQSWKENFK